MENESSAATSAGELTTAGMCEILLAMFTERATTTTTTTNDYNYTPRRGFRASVRHHPGVGVFGTHRPVQIGRVPFTKHPIRTCGNESTAPRDEVVSILKCPRNSHRRRARERARERATSKETFIVDAILTRTSVGGERPRRPGSRNSTREISNSRGNLLRASPTRHASALNASVAHRDGKKTVKVSVFTPLVASDWLAFERAIVGRVRDKNEKSNERMVRAFRAFFSIC